MIGCLAGPALAAGDALGREEALKAPVDVLAAKLFGRVAPAVTEVERPTFSGMMGPNAPITGLTFATRAHSSGNPGLCVATVINISASPADTGEFAYPPVETRQVFKVVSDLSPLPDTWNEAYGADLNRKCAAAGRVLPPGSGDLGYTAFFGLYEYSPSKGAKNEAWSAARIIAEALKSPPGRSIECKSAEKSDCAAPQQALASLDVRRLLAAGIRQCEADTTRTCVSGEFIRSARDNVRNSWKLDVTAAVKSRDGHIEIERLKLEAVGTIYD